MFGSIKEYREKMRLKLEKCAEAEQPDLVMLFIRGVSKSVQDPKMQALAKSNHKKHLEWC